MEERYIKTEIDGTISILKMNTCNLCPFLMYITQVNKTTCAKYYSPSNNSNITCSNVYSYTISDKNKLPIQSIDIPSWCQLGKDIKTVHIEKEYYIKNGQNKNMAIPISNDQKLSIISSLFVDYDRTLSKLVYCNNNPNTPYKYLKDDEKMSTALVVQKPIKETVKIECSCCGENKENIDRTKNNGMCNVCWEKYKNNEELKYFAFINNFRLKRKKNWTDEIHKKVVIL